MITFKNIDRVHQRPSGTAHRNFNENRHRFEVSKDYFFVKKTAK
ncbi:hypothetical protein [Desulfonema ishimotonii]